MTISTSDTKESKKSRSRGKKPKNNSNGAKAAAQETTSPAAEFKKAPEDNLPTTFAEMALDDKIQSALAEAGWTEPSPIQARAIPRALLGKDLIGVAQTGTGKTGAFLLPIMQKLQAPGEKIRALILLPTRELAQQVNKELDKFCPALGLRHTVVYGGTAMGLQRLKIREGVDVLVATPGRLLDLCQQTFIDWSGLEFLVLDEADRMLDMGFIPDIERIMRKLPMARQTMLFTATMAPVFKEIAQQHMLYPEEVQAGMNRGVAEGVTQWLFPVRQDQKTALLLELLHALQIDSGIIFCKTKVGTNDLGKTLEKKGFSVGILHSDRAQRDREKTLEQFRNSEVKILVATDVASRGIDISGITHVVNYDVPQNPDDYIHRVGRTARNKATGDAVTLIAPEQEKSFYGIEKLLEQKLPRHVLAGFHYRGNRPEGEEVNFSGSEKPVQTKQAAPIAKVEQTAPAKKEEKAGTEGGSARRQRKPRNPERAAKKQEEAPVKGTQPKAETPVKAKTESAPAFQPPKRKRLLKRRGHHNNGVVSHQWEEKPLPTRDGSIMILTDSDLHRHSETRTERTSDIADTANRMDEHGEIRSKRAFLAPQPKTKKNSWG